MSLVINRTALKNSAIIFMTIVFLYLPLMRVAGYNFTFGTAMALFIIAVTAPLALKGSRYAMLLFLAWVYPLVIYICHLALNTRYALGFGDFAKSYAIWVLSALLIWMGFQSRLRYVNANWSVLLKGITIFAVLQYIDNHYGTRMLTRLVEAIGTYNPGTYDPLGLLTSQFRAVGTYYEPSMLGRIVVTIGAIVLVREQKPELVGICIATILAVSGSFSVVVLGAGMFILFYANITVRKFFIFVVSAILVFVLFGDLILYRLASAGDFSYTATSHSSSFIRLVLPWFSVKEILPNYPFGVPIGGNEAVVKYTIAPLFIAHEAKITNGLYEFILLFGFPAVGLVIFTMLFIVRSVATGERTIALLAFFLLLSTAASSSYLNLESSLLLYFLITNLRMAQSEHIARRKLNRSGVNRRACSDTTLQACSGRTV